jgi:hypothetical protein
MPAYDHNFAGQFFGVDKFSFGVTMIGWYGERIAFPVEPVLRELRARTSSWSDAKP